MGEGRSMQAEAEIELGLFAHGQIIAIKIKINSSLTQAINSI